MIIRVVEPCLKVSGVIFSVYFSFRAIDKIENSLWNQ